MEIMTELSIASVACMFNFFCNLLSVFPVSLHCSSLVEVAAEVVAGTAELPERVFAGEEEAAAGIARVL